MVHSPGVVARKGWGGAADHPGGGVTALAAALAETGDFAEAVKWQQKALDWSEHYPKQQLETMRSRLELYKQGKPCRE